MRDLTMTGAVASGAETLSIAGLGVTDVDVCELYDAFTINTIVFPRTSDSAPRAKADALSTKAGLPLAARFVKTNGGRAILLPPRDVRYFSIDRAHSTLRWMNAASRSLRRPAP